MARPPEIDHAWAVRVVGGARALSEAKVYARNHAFAVGRAVSFAKSDAHPSAIELLLGALGGDLVTGLEAECARRSLAVHAIELRLEGRLENALVHLGVVGEEGRPGLETVKGTIFVGTDAGDAALEDAWRSVLARSPVYETLSRCATLSIELRAAP